MNKKKWLLTNMSLIALSCAQASLAGNLPGSVTFTAGDAYYHFSHKQDLKDRQLPNIALAYNFNEHWAIEGQWGFLNTKQTDSDDDSHFFNIFNNNDEGQSVHGNLYTIDGIYRFTPYHELEPYVLAGTGVLGLKPNTNNDSTQSGLINVGIGTQLFIANRVALRAEAKDVYLTTGNYKNDYMINLGLSFLFGGHEPCYKGEMT